MTNLFYIIDNIFLSNLFNANDINLIQSKNINIIIRLSEDHNNSIYDDSIIFYNFEIEDNFLYKKKIIEYSKLIYKIILDNPNKNILIHCNEGQSRSVSVIIYYLCMKYNYNYDQSYNYIKNIKSDIRPNNAFSFELKKLFDPIYINEYKHDSKLGHLEPIQYNIMNEYNDKFDEEQYKKDCLTLLLS